MFESPYLVNVLRSCLGARAHYLLECFGRPSGKLYRFRVLNVLDPKALQPNWPWARAWECGVFEGECFEVSREGDSDRAEMFLADWWAFCGTAEASWQAETSGQRRGNPGRDVFLPEFRPQGESLWRGDAWAETKVFLAQRCFWAELGWECFEQEAAWWL